jgi:UDP-N-acetyl-2-amino-2-deoxyglucuronate dehydrogenase
MADAVRFGFIGAGEIAVQTARAVAAAEHARLVAVADADPGLAADLAGSAGAEAVESPDDLLAREDVDAVYIAVPHFLHGMLAQAAARAGRHVLLEKPGGTTPDEGERILRTARDAGVTLSTPFVLRYTATWMAARGLVADGALGDIQGIRLAITVRKPDSYWHGGYSGRSRSDWRARLLQSGGGVLLMNAIHEIDAVRWATGLEAERVSAEHGTFATEAEVEDLAGAVVRYRGGAVGVIAAASHAPGGAGPAGDGGHRILGTRGQAVIAGDRLWVYTEESGSWEEAAVPQERDPRTALVEDYARALAAGEPPPIPDDAALEALKVVAAAYQSRQHGRAVRIEELFQRPVMAPRRTVG